MDLSVEISKYPLAEGDYVSAIKDFIDRVNQYDGIDVSTTHFSTQFFGEYSAVMEMLNVEMKESFSKYGAGIFVCKFILKLKTKIFGIISIMLEQLLNEFSAMSIWEYVAVLFGFLYLIFAIMQSSWCWPAAFISTFIYTVLFWQGALLLESLLNFYYLAMAVYGWYQWRGGISQPKQKPVVSWSFTRHVAIISALTIVAVVVGFIADEFTQQKFAYLDSFTTCFAVFTTYLVTQKVLENWLYWIVIDIASVYLYIQTGYLPTAALFVVYTVLALQGYREWQADYLRQTQSKEEDDSVTEISGEQSLEQSGR